ncbi:MAG: TolC family protein [Gammaproteobacteria bacterium]|nr:TolC family protein [Gammaproteobacteria bacterium]
MPARLARVCAAVCALLAGPAQALTEEQFIKLVLAQDKLLEEAQIGLDIKQIELDASRDNYLNWKPLLTASAGYSYRDLDRRKQRLEYTKKQIGYPQRISISAEKKFLSNPASIRVGVSRAAATNLLERHKNNMAVEKSPVYEEHFASTRSVSFKYPLLKHDSNAAGRKAYQRNILDLRDQQLAFFETKEDFLEDRLNDYLEWVLHHRNSEINGEFLERYKRLDTADAAETALLKSAVFRIEQYNAETQNDLRAVREKLAVLLDDRRILRETPRFDFRKRAKLLGGDRAAYLRARNRDLARIGIDIELKQIDLAHSKNRLLPSLDLTVTAEDSSFSGSTRTNFNFHDDRDNYTAALVFSHPLGGGAITDRTAVQIAHLTLRKLGIAYREKLQDLLADIQSLHGKLALDEPRLLAAVDAAAQSARIELENYRAGKSSFRDVLQAYRDWRDAKIEHIQDVIDYQEDSIEYDNLLDRMIAQP